jgi:hypothetical protein
MRVDDIRREYERKVLSIAEIRERFRISNKGLYALVRRGGWILRGAGTRPWGTA